MSDKFLNTGGSGNADISNGTINAYIASLTVASLRPSMPLKTNSVNTLVSTKLDITDINNLESRLDEAGGITNPYVGDFKATDFETDDYFSINDELQKVDNFTASTATDTNLTGILKVPEVATGRLYDSTQSTFIDLDGSDVAISATDLTLNGSSVISEVGNKNLVNTLTTSQTAFTLDQELITKKYFIDSLPGTADLNTKTQNISLTDTTATKTTMTQDLNIVSPPTGTDITAFDGQGADLAIDGTTAGQLYVKTGFEFTALSNLKNIRFKIKSSQRSTSNESNRFVVVYEYNYNTNQYSFVVSISMGLYNQTSLPPIVEGDFNLSYAYTDLNYVAGRKYAVVINASAGDFFSVPATSPITVDSNISVIGSIRTDAFGNFPASTNDGYSPIITLQYQVAEVFDKKLSCGLIDNKNGTIINVSDPTNLQDVSTKNYVDTATTGIAGLETKTQNISTTTTAGNTKSTGNQQILLGASIGGDTFSITGGAVGDAFFARIMDMNGTGVNTVVPLNTGVVRPDVDNTRDIGTTSLKYRDIYTDKVFADKIEVSNITAPANPGSGKGVIYKKTGSNGLFYKAGASAPEEDLTNPGTMVSAVNSVDCTSSSYVLMPNMTLTPGAGTYLVMFGGNFTEDASGEAVTEYGVFNNGTLVASSRRRAWIEATNYYTPLSTQTLTTVADAQTIEVRWKETSGTPSVEERSLILVKVG